MIFTASKMKLLYSIIVVLKITVGKVRHCLCFKLKFKCNLESPMVTICTTKFTIQKFYLLPTERVYAIFCIWKADPVVIMFLYGIN